MGDRRVRDPGEWLRKQRPQEQRQQKRTQAGVGSSTVGATVATAGLMTTGVQILFYVSTICLVGFLLLIVLHYTTVPVFSFMPGSPGIFPISVPTNRQQDFMNAIAPADVPANITNILPSQYTLSFDIFIQSDFIVQTVPRILLYNSINPLNLTATDTIDSIGKPISASAVAAAEAAAAAANAKAAIAGYIASNVPVGERAGAWGAAATERDLASAAAKAAVAAITTEGLSGTNIIVYLDSQINDLYVRVITGPGSHLDSNPIKNVPLRTPLRITIMVSSVLLEVYLNGLLKQTLPLGNTPPATITNSSFFGPPVLIQQAVAVTNISYWNTMLPSKSIRLYAAEPFQHVITTMK